MFTNFFYQLRQEGIPVSITEWMTLMEALNTGLADSSLTGFYYLARAILVKSETQFDKYDVAFQKHFKGVETPDALADQVTEWMKNPLSPKMFTEEERKKILDQLGFPDWDTLRKEIEERLRTQDGAHHGGNKWIGTGGTSPYGHSGFHPGGVRIGGESHGRSAVKVASEHKYQEYRSDKTLAVRQFEVALRRLRRFSSKIDGPKDVLDLEATIDATCKNAGQLKLEWTRPRKNAVKVMLLMDVGGSMTPFAEICSQLFTAVNRASHFKDLQFYYFHNCVYDIVYTDASLSPKRAVKTETLLRNLESNYKIILVGDAAMAPSELLSPGGNIFWGIEDNEPGLTWLERVARKFTHAVWLNPISSEDWDDTWGSKTVNLVRQVFPMYELTLEGIEEAIKKLMVRK